LTAAAAAAENRPMPADPSILPAAARAAPRADPLAFFSVAEWAGLTRRSPWRGPWLVLHCWAVIALAMAMGVMWPLTIPLAVLLIGSRQLGLFILMHDAAHGLLHPNRRLNDWIGAWLCSYTLHAYRPYHLQHHRHVQQAQDPDLVLSAPFPIRRASLRRKALRDLSGQTFYRQRLRPLLRPAPASSTGQELAKGARFLLGNGIGLLLFAAAGLWWAWLAMWLLPMMTWLPWISRVRNIAEHALLARDESDPLRQARTTRAGWLERVLLAPYWVNYHAEHHLFTQVPCWNLPKAHALLRRRGVTPRMEVRGGYGEVLRRATATAAVE